MSKLKTYDLVLAAVVAGGFLLFQYVAESLDVTKGAGLALTLLAVVVVASAFGMFVYDKMVTNPVEVGSTEVPQPAISRFLFHDTRAAAFWLILRFYVGFQWLEAGFHKATGTGWLDGGTALKGYWTKAVVVDPKTGTGPISNDYGWYRNFLQLLLDNNAHTWFAKLIVYGEILVGIGIIVGGLVGIAAFFGALMNMSFMLAGSASTNPVLFFLGVLLMLGWQVAGYYGVDRFILPVIGAPWRPGKIFHRGSPVPVSVA